MDDELIVIYEIYSEIQDVVDKDSALTQMVHLRNKSKEQVKGELLPLCKLLNRLFFNYSASNDGYVSDDAS